MNEADIVMNEYRDREWVKDFDPVGDTFVVALILAIKYEDQQSVTSLLTKQVDVNARDDENDWTPLLYAVHEGSLEIVRLLVNSGADVNIQGSYQPEQDFALNMAAYSKSRELFEYLAPLTCSNLRLITEQNFDDSTHSLGSPYSNSC
jgi:ankyrin repeat protein